MYESSMKNSNLLQTVLNMVKLHPQSLKTLACRMNLDHGYCAQNTNSSETVLLSEQSNLFLHWLILFV